ncbi:hypothetical protein CDL15_Pgr003616 [Punica granatum]|uniref:Uncharacterized protein n=1 Tax=Punica granatum TaxID=22663 RepID=A0A218XTE2_PUNGR|nr:hypothetical protein CDL15_Pgr003616 [Punica granatum]
MGKPAPVGYMNNVKACRARILVLLRYCPYVAIPRAETTGQTDRAKEVRKEKAFIVLFTDSAAAVSSEALGKEVLFQYQFQRVAVFPLAEGRISAGEGHAMTAETAKKSGPPQIVTSDKAFRLAEQWVNNMSKAADDEPVEAETESRPLRLGLGAKVSRQTKPGRFSDPIARKLFSNLQAGKRKAAKENEESSIVASNTVNDGDSEDDLESRTSVFVKKRVAPPPGGSSPAQKKRK